MVLLFSRCFRGKFLRNFGNVSLNSFTNCVCNITLSSESLKLWEFSSARDIEFGFDTAKNEPSKIWQFCFCQNVNKFRIENGNSDRHVGATSALRWSEKVEKREVGPTRPHGRRTERLIHERVFRSE